MAANNHASDSQQTRWQLLLSLLLDESGSFGSDEAIISEDENNFDFDIHDSLILTRSRLRRTDNQDLDSMPTLMDIRGDENAIGEHKEIDDVDIDVRDSLQLARNRLRRINIQDHDMPKQNDDIIVNESRDSVLLNRRRLQRARDESKYNSKIHSISTPLAALPKPEKLNIYKYAPQA